MKMKKGNINVRAVLSAASMVVVAAASFAFAFFYPVSRPILGGSVVCPSGWEMVKIDGNANGRSVRFTHKKHFGRAGEGDDSCAFCHHLAFPGNDITSCSRCHTVMTGKKSIFDHQAHISRYPKHEACAQCHRGDRSPENTLACATCHPDYRAGTGTYMSVRGYREAMHGNCFKCHDESVSEGGKAAFCGTCHARGDVEIR